MTGLLLAVQFFTSLPVRKELPMEKRDVTGMYMALPFIGGGIGLVMYGISWLFTDGMETGAFLAAVAAVIAGIGLTGGLHLDGWADTGDAYFSYKDRAKRLEILSDPRLGAFGTMALVVLIIVKIALIHEFLMKEVAHSVWLFAAVPFLARVAMNLFFTTMPLAKPSGIAHFFKEKMEGRTIAVWSSVMALLLLPGIGFLFQQLLFVSVLALVLLVIVYISRKWSMKHFGGVSGDLCGACIEGTEAVTWILLLVFM